VVNTGAFSGYADGRRALGEMTRVLKRGGRIVILDANYPRDGNWLGVMLTRLVMATGDVVRDMGGLFQSAGLTYEDYQVGWWGGIHLYIVDKS
jgi:ubiquinone/menaquinone biosynthesis C-methylase UbiE